MKTNIFTVMVLIFISLCEIHSVEIFDNEHTFEDLQIREGFVSHPKGIDNFVVDSTITGKDLTIKTNRDSVTQMPLLIAKSLVKPRYTQLMLDRACPKTHKILINNEVPSV